jgi:hypothetical protein
MAELNSNRNSVLDEAIGACLAAVPTAAAQMRMGTAAALHAACADAVRALKTTSPFANPARGAPRDEKNS